jgi:ATP/maltotriose-dependent transcriptional regulator MalT
MRSNWLHACDGPARLRNWWIAQAWRNAYGFEIVREFRVSLSTVWADTLTITTRMGVNNRRTAVRRAEALDLL